MHTLASLLLVVASFSLAACATSPDEYTLTKGGKQLTRIEAEREFVQKDLGTQVQPPLDSPIKLLHVRFPEYPRELKRLGDGPTTTVALMFTVKSTGVVSDVKVLGMANTALAEVCMNAVREWRFEPPSRGGKDVDLQLQFRFVFKLQR